MGCRAVSLQIAKLILYSRQGDVRELPFRPGALNTLTGASKTGKSAIIDIVDYVTGRSECNVADGVIRKYVGWYALLFQLNDGRSFIARRNPEVGERTSGDVYMDRGSSLQTPAVADLIKNTAVDALEKFLTAAIGISENEHRPAMPTRVHLRPISATHCCSPSRTKTTSIANSGCSIGRARTSSVPRYWTRFHTSWARSMRIVY